MPSEGLVLHEHYTRKPGKFRYTIRVDGSIRLSGIDIEGDPFTPKGRRETAILAKLCSEEADEVLKQKGLKDEENKTTDV
jgi:hypothetical protein